MTTTTNTLPSLQDLTQATLAKFTSAFPDIKTEPILRIRADQFLQSNPQIDTYAEIAHYIRYPDFIHFLENRMSECDYTNLIWLANDAMTDLLWDYITDYYDLPDLDLHR